MFTFANPPYELRLGLGQQLREPRDLEAPLPFREIKVRQVKSRRVDHGETLVVFDDGPGRREAADFLGYSENSRLRRCSLALAICS